MKTDELSITMNTAKGQHRTYRKNFSYHVRLDRTYNLSSPIPPLVPPTGGNGVAQLRDDSPISMS